MVRKAIVGLAALLTSTAAQAAWEFDVVTNPMTDATRGISSLKGGDDFLVVKCDTNGLGTLYLTVVSRDFIGSLSTNRNRPIQYRFDGGAIQTVDAIHDNTYLGLFNVRPGTPGGKFLSQLAGSKKLVIQASGFDSEQHFFEFDTTGAGEAISHAAAACGDAHWM